MNNLIYSETNTLVSKEDYGICYCGGGLRACVLTYGGVSGLGEIMSKIKYISGVSGATWFIGGFTYYNNQIIFDKYLEPENCTMENINLLEKNGFGETLNNVNLATELAESFFDFTDRKINKWNTVVYESFFEQYGKDVKPNYNFEKTPFPLICSSISYNGVNERFFPIEFTPEYASVPIYYKKNNFEYGGYNVGNENVCTNYKIVPYVQSGVSSAFFEAGKELITANVHKGTTYKLFNPNTKQVNPANLVDGGVYDNSGIDGLLRRKVKNIHMNIFPNTPLTSDKFMSKVNYFTSLFKGNPESDKYGIFKLGLWDEVYNKLLYKLSVGLPLTVCVTTNVDPNEFFQIEGYTNVNFLFHISSCSQDWFNKLPNETQKYINDEINDFPYIKTTKYKLNSKEINLMYNCVIYDVKNSQEYKEFYKNKF
jgi:hypothetical protein